MCGRYVLFGPHSRLMERFGLRECPEFAPRYNIAPQSDIPIVRWRPQVGRVGQIVRWGLVPHWAKDPAVGLKLINARAESLAEKAPFRTAFERHRCLIPANGFYEWQAVTETGKVRKQPWYVRCANEGGFFAMAGLLAHWVSPEGEDLVSACIVTTQANETMAPIHERMPAMIGDQDWEAWLDPENRDTEALKRLLSPAPNRVTTAYRVDTAVNKAGNEGSGLIAPQDE